MNINETLKERGEVYGEFADLARTAAGIRAAIMRGSYVGPPMPAVQSEAICMIATKLARIVNGAHGHVDSWRDIAGYAQLVVRELEK